MKANLHRDGNRHEAFQRRHVFDVRSDVGHQQVGILARLGVASVHGATHGHKMQIVAVIHHRINTLRARLLDVRTVHFCSFLVGLNRGFIVSGADVNMGGHVNDVAGPRREPGQPIGSRQRAVGIIRSLDRVNVVVDRAQVIGIALDHALERAHNLFGASNGRSVLIPQSPGMQVHAGLGEQRCSIEIIGELVRHLAHGVVIILGRFLQIGDGVRRKALRHRLNVSLLAGRGIGRELRRVLDRIVGALITFGIGWIVVVGTNSFGNSPIGHGQLRIKFRRVLKRACGLIVIKGVDEAQTLIKKLLCFRILGRDRMTEVA